MAKRRKNSNRVSIISEPRTYRGNESRVVLPNGTLAPISAFANGYSSATQSRSRGYIVFPQLDTSRVLNTSNRTEMLRKSRFLVTNNGLAKKIVKLVARALGNLRPSPKSIDTAWCSMAVARFDRHCNSPQLFSRSGKYNIAGYQRHIGRKWGTDGELLSVFAAASTGPQIATYGAHQIKSREQEDKNPAWYDGVKVDAGGRHLQYSVLDPEGKKIVPYLPASAAHLSTTWDDHDQVRGVTPFHPIINRMLDVQEITGDMMLGIKSSNQMGFYIAQTPESPGGIGAQGLGAGLNTYVEELISRAANDPDNDDVEIRKVAKKYEEVFAGGAIPEFEPGQTPGVLHDDRPAQNQMDLLRWFVREVCLAFDLPYEAVWEFLSLNGNTSRLMNVDFDESMAALRSDLIEPFMQKCWFFVIGWFIETGQIPMPTDGNWWECKWVPPKRRSIDRGAEGRLNLEELAKPGVRTLERHHHELQQNWKLEVGQWLDEYQHIMTEAYTKGFTGVELASLQSMLLHPPAGVAAMDPPVVDDETDI